MLKIEVQKISKNFSLSILAFFSVFLFSCGHMEVQKETDNIPKEASASMKPVTTESAVFEEATTVAMELTTTIESLINAKELKKEIALDHLLIINEDKDALKWHVSLGKRDFKNVIIEKYENNSQKSIRFTKIGTYQVKLSSHRSKAQRAIMVQTITIVVK